MCVVVVGGGQVGSIMRVMALMHWMSDVLVGVLAGVAIGAGLPTMLFRSR
jgi:membrane-associated phospholipid phosphatase